MYRHVYVYFQGQSSSSAGEGGSATPEVPQVRGRAMNKNVCIAYYNILCMYMPLMKVDCL